MSDIIVDDTLTVEQQGAMENGHRLYVAAISMLETDKRTNGLDLLAESFETLNKFIDDVDNIYYRVLFANVVQEMQDTGEFDLSKGCIIIKTDIYLQTLKWFQRAESYQTKYKSLLWGVFLNMGKILIKGDEMPQSDEVARICYENLKMLGHPFADFLLDMFVLDENNKWVYKGKRTN